MFNTNNKSNSFVKAVFAAFSIFCFASLGFALPSTAETNLQATPGVSFVTSGSTLSLTAPDRAVLNWNAFGSGANQISAGDTIAYNLPNSNSSILNVISGGAASTIDGHLTSNGNVYILNPNGIVIGANSRFDTKSLVVSTVDSAFAGQFQYLNTGKLPSQSGTRTASGAITVNGGSIINADNIVFLTKDIAINGSLLNGSLAVYADGAVSVGSANNTVYGVSSIDILNTTGNTVIGAVGGSVASNASILVSTVSGNVSNSIGATVSARSLALNSQSGDINVSGVNGVNVSVSAKNASIAFGNAPTVNLSADVSGTLLVNSQNAIVLENLKNSSGATTVTSAGKITLGNVHIDSSAQSSFTGSSIADLYDNVFIYGPTAFTSIVGDISLLKSGHSFGPLSFNSVGNAVIYENSAMNLNVARAKNITLKTNEFFFQTPTSALINAEKFNLTANGTVGFFTATISNGLTVDSSADVDLSKLSLSTSLNGVPATVNAKGNSTPPSL